jgi:hypothetical protein
MFDWLWWHTTPRQNYVRASMRRPCPPFDAAEEH